MWEQYDSEGKLAGTPGLCGGRSVPVKSRKICWSCSEASSGTLQDG